MTKEGKYVSSLDEITENKRSFPASVFPPANVKDLHLERWYVTVS